MRIGGRGVFCHDAVSGGGTRPAGCFGDADQHADVLVMRALDVQAQHVEKVGVLARRAFQQRPVELEFDPVHAQVLDVIE